MFLILAICRFVKMVAFNFFGALEKNIPMIAVDILDQSSYCNMADLNKIGRWVLMRTVKKIWTIFWQIRDPRRKKSVKII